MLADDPKINEFTRAYRSLSAKLQRGYVPDEESTDLPVRRIGLEQEFFLVDNKGALCDLADLFLWRCREATQAEGLDPRCFKAE
jgi:hypothetical protein